MLTAWVSLMLEHLSGAEEAGRRDTHGAFQSHADITWTGVKDLEYLGAVINETFRICAPVPTNLCRVVPPEGASIDGSWVPGGVSCLFLSYSPLPPRLPAAGPPVFAVVLTLPGLPFSVSLPGLHDASVDKLQRATLLRAGAVD